MTKMIPLISSGTAGPLGLLHLPRVWLKALLGATGMLADGYTDVGPGYDFMLFEAIGIDPDKAREFIHSQKPSYSEFEKWVVAYPGVKLDPATITAINAAITGYNHEESVRKSILSASEIPDDGAILDAINLNNLDDWNETHAALTGA
jgi:hypothetical protein